MKKLIWGAGLVLLVSGCTSMEMAKYKVTSFAEVPLTAQAKVKVVSQKGSDVGLVVEALKSELTNSGKYSVVDADADYWFILGGNSASAEPTQIKFQVKTSATTETGGHDAIKDVTKHISSGAKGVSVAVYNALDLSPVHYFEISQYDGDVSDEAARDAETYERDFAKYAVERIMDTFVTQEKTIDTPVSAKGDKKLRELLSKAGAASSADAEKCYEGAQKTVAKKYADFVRQYKLTPGKIDLAKMLAALEAKEYKGPSADELLSDYHMYLLVSEFNATRKADRAKLKEIQMQLLRILEHTEESGLVEAIPVALARLEYKLANLKK